ncbi:hypothetical protein APR12_004162 [Nocardia amikacinitolerans]|nr:hypothetical protein [Nocardia amikacinitolerans]
MDAGRSVSGRGLPSAECPRRWFYSFFQSLITTRTSVSDPKLLMLRYFVGRQPLNDSMEPLRQAIKN